MTTPEPVSYTHLKSDQSRTARASHVSPECEQSKHGSPTAAQRLRRFAERSGPHDADRKSADCACRKADKRNRDQNDSEIRKNTEQTAEDHKTIQIDPVSIFTIEKPGSSHQDGKCLSLIHIF